MSKKNDRIIIYQLMPRLYTNAVVEPRFNGGIDTNGVGKFNHYDAVLLRSLRKLGATHVWFTGILRHATTTDYSTYGIPRSHPDVVKGKAGSPYAVTDYYDVDPDLAVDVNNRITEFQDLVKRVHRAKLKCIIDFVPNHVAREYKSVRKPTGIQDLGQGDRTDYFFYQHNNFYYLQGQDLKLNLAPLPTTYTESPAKVTGNDCISSSPSPYDWYETVKLNYGRDISNDSCHFEPIPDTWHKMLHILLYWADMGIDGFRCDMVHMVPLEFWHWAIAEVKAKYPKLLFIGEIYDVAIYNDFIQYGGFDYLYDKVTLYDTLFDVLAGNRPAAELTRCWQTTQHCYGHMLHFMENHDEVRLASRFDALQAFVAMAVSATVDRQPLMIYGGQEFGEPAIGAQGYSGNDGRTTIFDYYNIPSIQRWYNNGKCDGTNLTQQERELYQKHEKLLKLCNTNSALREGEFFDLMYVNYDRLDAHSHYAYLRAVPNSDVFLLIVANFSSNQAHLSLHIPEHAYEVLSIQVGEYVVENLLNNSCKCREIITLPQNLKLQAPAHDIVILQYEMKSSES